MISITRKSVKTPIVLPLAMQAEVFERLSLPLNNIIAVSSIALLACCYIEIAYFGTL